VDNPGLREAIHSWLLATTDNSSPRFDDLLRDKARPVAEFFSLVGKAPNEVRIEDVKRYHELLESRELTKSTVYAMLSRVSSFYKWLGDLPQFKGNLSNPVAAARPKAPKPYQSESTKSLTDEDVRALVEVLREGAQNSVIGKRDFAMFVTYLLTGLRRAEVARLRWGDLNLSGLSPTFTYRAKGGSVITREIDERIREAILDYLAFSGRQSGMGPDTPLWVSHDRANVNPGQRLTTHAFAKNLKKYARQAGLSHIHIHQTRHTYARIVADQTGSLVETQDALGHVNAATTRVYVQRVGVKKDKHGDKVAKRFGL
jgi:integrase